MIDVSPGHGAADLNRREAEIAIRATIISSIITALYVLNYEYGWIGADVLDVLPQPPVDLQD